MKPFISKKLLKKLRNIKKDSFYKKRDVLKKLGFRHIGSGVSCHCYVKGTVVVKLGTHHWKLTKRMKQYKKFFPQTIVIDREFCIQERCSINAARFYDEEDAIDNIASFLGVDDLHSNNVGWKKVEGEWSPVFFDLGFTTHPYGTLKKNKAIPSWVLFGMRIT